MYSNVGTNQCKPLNCKNILLVFPKLAGCGALWRIIVETPILTNLHIAKLFVIGAECGSVCSGEVGVKVGLVRISILSISFSSVIFDWGTQ